MARAERKGDRQTDSEVMLQVSQPTAPELYRSLLKRAKAVKPFWSFVLQMKTQVHDFIWNVHTVDVTVRVH